MKIGVVGLGLIGGSIFKALKEKYDLVAVSNSVKEENVSNDYNILKGCNIVFVCTPINATLEVLDKLEGILNANTIVTDVSSIKGFVSDKIYNYKFIPSHPMAGTENKGWSNSFPELFQNAKWVITPVNGEILQGQEILETIIKELGAEVIITTAEEHDKAVALISHMPLIIAQALCLNIKNNKLAQTLASSGFRDTTRLALSNLEMATDIFEYNTENINKSLEMLENSVELLLKNDYINISKQIQEFRRNLY